MQRHDNSAPVPKSFTDNFYTIDEFAEKAGYTVNTLKMYRSRNMFNIPKPFYLGFHIPIWEKHHPDMIDFLNRRELIKKEREERKQNYD